MTDKRFSDWFKKNIPEKGLPENATFTKQFLLDAWHNGYVCGCIEAKEELKSLEIENADLKEIVAHLITQPLDDESSFCEGLSRLYTSGLSRKQIAFVEQFI